VNRYFKLDPSPVTFSWASKGCLTRMAEIDGQSFHGAAWSRSMFDLVLTRPKHIALIAHCDSRIAGYVVFDLSSITHIQLIRLAVDPTYRRRNVGRGLVGQLTGRLSYPGRTSIACRICETDDAARDFLVRCGFRCAGLDRNYFGERDAYVMAWNLIRPKAKAAAPSAEATVAALEAIDRECQGR
jgi:ribosomal protein S18 acetylase RimI-like enzyme